MVLLVALAVAAPRPDASRLPDGRDGHYAELTAAIEVDRRALAASGDLAGARAYLLEAIPEHIVPAWLGTPWAFYGTSESPGAAGSVACGYWVASVLRDLGFVVDRNHLGKQASERILLTFAAPTGLRHFGRDWLAAIAWVRAKGPGLWGVGLANHTGFLWNDGTEVRFCHSNYMGVRGPMCEDAEHSGAFQTSYTVLASVLGDDTLRAWLARRPLTTGGFATGGGP